MIYTESMLTPEFDGSVKPVRPGLYLRVYSCGLYLDYFDGEKWRYASQIGCACSFQEREWRGLNFDPTASADQ